MVEADSTIEGQSKRMTTLVRRAADEGLGFWDGRDGTEYLRTERELDEAIDAASLDRPTVSRWRLDALAKRDEETRDARARLAEALADDAINRAIEENLRRCIAPGCDEWLSRATHRDSAGYHDRQCQHRTDMALRRARVATAL